MKDTSFVTVDECINECERRETGMVEIVKDDKIYHFISNDVYNTLVSLANDAKRIKKVLGDEEYVSIIRKCFTVE